MIRFDREIDNPEIIEEMLKVNFTHCCLGMFDEEYPYVIPVNYGFEMLEDKIIFYLHTFKHGGYKLNLLKNNPNVCLTFSAFSDFPDRKYRQKYHDFRSVVARGKLSIIDGDKDIETFKKGYELLYFCNNRKIVPIEKSKATKRIYILKVECNLIDVSGKAEFPIRSKKDVPIVNSYDHPIDERPLDISDIIAEKKKKMKDREVKKSE